MQTANGRGLGVLVWAALAVIGLLTAIAPQALARNGHLRRDRDPQEAAAAR